MFWVGFFHNSTCNSIYAFVSLTSRYWTSAIWIVFPPLHLLFTFKKLTERKKMPFLSLKDSNHHKHCCSPLAISELCLLSLRTWSFKSDWAVSSSRLQHFTSSGCFLPDWVDLDLSICTVPFQLHKQAKMFRFYMMPRPWEDTFLTVDQIMEDSVWHVQDHHQSLKLFWWTAILLRTKTMHTRFHILFRSVQFHSAFKISQFWTKPQEQLVPLAGGWLTGRTWSLKLIDCSVFPLKVTHADSTNYVFMKNWCALAGEATLHV